MVTLLILVCIIIFIVSAKKGRKKKDILNIPVSPSKEEVVKKAVILSSNSPSYMGNYDRILRVMEERQIRNRRIWSVLFIINSINKCQELHPSKKDWQDLDNAIVAVKEYKPQYRDIQTAIRFCQSEYSKGYCNRELTKQDLFVIRNIRQLIELNKLPVERPKSI